jgi:hypothetical protein
MITWAWIVFTVFSSSCGDILCAKGMSEGAELEEFGPKGIGRTLRYIVTRRLVILGWVFYAVSFFSLMGLFSVAELTVAVPATALSFVIDTLGAFFVLHEHIPWKRWLGVLCVSAGVVLAIQQPAKPAPVVRTAMNLHAEDGKLNITLTRTSGANRAAVQAGQHQSAHDHARSHDFHQESASSEVLAKP